MGGEEDQGSVGMGQRCTEGEGDVWEGKRGQRGTGEQRGLGGHGSSGGTEMMIRREWTAGGGGVVPGKKGRAEEG